jgi:hypothetical protein
LALFQKGQSGNPRGKPRGALNRDTRAILEAAKATGETPLAIMLMSMHRAWDAGNVEDATKFAAMAAPYCHPRLQAVEHAGNADKPLKLEVSWRHGDNEAPELPLAQQPKVY